MRGFLYLLTLLDKGPKALGFKRSHHSSVYRIAYPCTVRYPLGFGSFGVVMNVVSDDDMLEYALKLPRFGQYTAHWRGNEEQHFRAEVKSLQLLQGATACVPEVYASDLVQYPPYIVMTAGQGVYEFIRQFGRLIDERRRIINIMHEQITQALGVVHSMGYCHTDIRPHNFVFSKPQLNVVGKIATFQCLLVDWGLMTSVGQPMHTYVGGIKFMHDEIIEAYNNNFNFVLAEPKYDIMAFAYSRNTILSANKNFEPVWQNAAIGSMIALRRDVLA